MLRRIIFTITVFSFFLLLATPVVGNISWSWSFGTEAGNFVTDGDLVGGVAPADTYTIDPSTFSVTASIVPDCIGGSYGEGSQPIQYFDWDGTAPTCFYRDNGYYDNGTNMYLLPSGVYRYTLYVEADLPGGLLVYDDDVYEVSAPLTVEPMVEPGPIELTIDIKPGSCPNPLNVKSKGVLPVAVLGTESLDVIDIDVGSVRLEGIAPIRFDYEDVATPFEGELCDCHEEGPDGYLDLTLKFDTQEIVAALGAIADGEELPLFLSLTLADGTVIEGSDCILIIKKDKD